MIAFLLTSCLLLSGCSLFDSKPSPKASDVVGDNGVDLTVAGVHIVVPPGSVPTGTKVQASFEDQRPTGIDPEVIKTLTQAFKIRLGDGAQPSKPITVTVPVDKDQLLAEQQADAPTTVAMMVQSEGAAKPDLIQGTWDPAAGTVSAQVPHLSWVWPVQLNLSAVMKTVHDFVMQSLNVEYPRPDCADKPVTIGATSYSPVSPAQAWLCVGESNGSLVVTASPNSPIPFLTTTAPTAGAGNKTEVSLATAFAVAVADNSGLAEKHQAIMMPGAAAEYTFDGTPASDVRVGFKQFPVMLLVSILAKVVDVALGAFADSKALQAVAKAECMQNVVDTSQAGTAVSVEAAVGVVKSFFACVGTIVKLSPPAQVLMAILTAGPQFLVTSALGIVNELTGASIFEATIFAVKIAGPATKFVQLDPWHDGSASSASSTYDGSTAAQPQGASCSRSEIAVRDDGYRCFRPGTVTDPCFQSPSSSSDFLCLAPGPGGKPKVTKLTSMRAQPPAKSTTAPADKAPPVWIELSDGTVCARATGAGPKGVPGYSFWVGTCTGPSGGVWRVGDSNIWANDALHYSLYPGTGAGRWQAAISVGSETAPVKLLDVATVWH